jgi:hypothetical protein
MLAIMPRFKDISQFLNKGLAEAITGWDEVARLPKLIRYNKRQRGKRGIVPRGLA